MSLRNYQTEINWIPEVNHMIIKTYIQTDEEAGGRGKDRRVMLTAMAGTVGYWNGIEYQYCEAKVGQCKDAPREYATNTILITSPTNVVILKGDWDYNVLTEKLRSGEIK